MLQLPSTRVWQPYDAKNKKFPFVCRDSLYARAFYATQAIPAGELEGPAWWSLAGVEPNACLTAA